MQAQQTLYIRCAGGVRRYNGEISDDGLLDDGTPIEDLCPWLRSEHVLSDEQVLLALGRIERLEMVGAEVDTGEIVRQVLAGELPVMSDLDFALLGFDCATSSRAKYDYLIDLMEDFKCFEGIDGRPCMFESYGTLVNFKALPAFVDAFGQERTEQAIEVLRACEFTPLASLVGTYLGYCLKGWAKQILEAREKTEELALAA